MNFTLTRETPPRIFDIQIALERLLDRDVEPERVLVYLEGHYQDPRSYTYNDSGRVTYLKSAIGKYLYDGATIVINDVQNLIPDLKTIFENATQERKNHQFKNIKANCYISGLNAQGIDLHSDDYDVCLYQLTGKKSWKIASHPDESKPTYIDLHPGDQLFLSTGTYHQAVTQSTISVHLTLRWSQSDASTIHANRPHLDLPPHPAPSETSYFESIINFRENEHISLHSTSGKITEYEKTALLNVVHECKGFKKNIEETLGSLGFNDLLATLLFADEIRIE